MKKISLLLCSLLFITGISAQEDNKILMGQPAGPIPVKHLVTHPHTGDGPANNHVAKKTTSGGTYSDWYDLWDEMFDTTSLTLPHSHLYYYDIAPDSNIQDITGFYPIYNIFTHGLGMSFDPSDSAYYYYPVNTAYQPSTPFVFTSPYALDSFWVPGEYQRHDGTSTIVDSLIVEFFVNQAGSTPDSGAYALVSMTANPIYHPFTADETPRFVTPRYFNTNDECVDPLLTTVTHQRYAFPLTITDNAVYKQTKFGLTTPIIVYPGHYIAAYVYFKPQVVYPLGTTNYNANYYWLYAGEPRGDTTWFPQSARNTTIGYPGSHQAGLIATNQVRYNSAGFTFDGHNVLLPCSAYANTGPNLPPGFDVPYMAFHINWPLPALDAENTVKNIESVNAFPNPAIDMLNISFTLNNKANARPDEPTGQARPDEPFGQVKIWLVNTVGQTVASKTINNASNGTAEFTTASLPAGVYMYILESGGERSIGRFLVMH